MSGKAVRVLLFMAQLSAVMAAERWSTTQLPPTGSPKNNLAGKMVTLTSYGGGGGITFYPPYYSPDLATNVDYRWTTRYPGPTPPRTRGVSVCLSFIKDQRQYSSNSIFRLDPRGYGPLWLDYNGQDYILSQRGSSPSFLLTPNLQIWPNIYPSIWTRVCLTVDNVKNVAQLFSGSHMSARKLIPAQFVWSGRPIIDFLNFDGQVTDVQVWDYPLSPSMVYFYMIGSAQGLSNGNALTWSNIGYKASGPILVEDNYLYGVNEEAGRGGSPGPRKETKILLFYKRGGRMKNQM